MTHKNTTHKTLALAVFGALFSLTIVFFRPGATSFEAVVDEAEGTLSPSPVALAHPAAATKSSTKDAVDAGAAEEIFTPAPTTAAWSPWVVSVSPLGAKSNSTLVDERTRRHNATNWIVDSVWEVEGVEWPVRLTTRVEVDAAGSVINAFHRGAAIANELLVQTSDLDDLRTVLAGRGVEIVRTSPHLGLARLALGTVAIEVVDEVLAEVAALGVTEVAELHHMVFQAGVPNDPGYANDTHLQRMAPELAWALMPEGAVTPSGRVIVIASVDSGHMMDNSDFDYWINVNESFNGKDDDGNEFIDDVYGVNFSSRNNQVHSTSAHGNAVARIAASRNNNGIGSASPAGRVRLMAVPYTNGSTGGLFNALDAAVYAIYHGADVVNCSFVGGGGAFWTAIAMMAGSHEALVIGAAGNGSSNNDDFPQFPGAHPYRNIIGVAASSLSDVNQSNFGPNSIEVHAPGSATSWTTPLVSSAVALLFAQDEHRTAMEVRDLLLSGVDKVPSLANRNMTGGRVNLSRSILLGMGKDPDRDFAVDVRFPFSETSGNRVRDESMLYLMGELRNGASLQTGAVSVNNGGHVLFTNSAWINFPSSGSWGTALAVRPNDRHAAHPQVLYRHGGEEAGVTIYIQNNQVYAGMWNTLHDQGWTGTWVAAELPPTEWIDVGLTLNAEKGPGLHLHLNGKTVSSARAGIIGSQAGQGAIGAAPQGARLLSGWSNGSHPFSGSIANVRFFQRSWTPDASGFPSLEEVAIEAPPPSPDEESPEPDTLPHLLVNEDIGLVQIGGNAWIDGDRIGITASGRDIWNTADEFHYAHTEVSGDFTAVVQVHSLENTDPWAKVGLMMRESLAPGSRHEMIIVSGSSGISHQRRASTNGSSASQTRSGIVAPVWLRIARSGSVITSAHSFDGVNWVTRATHTVTYPERVRLGIATTSHNSSRLTIAVLSDFSLNGTNLLALNSSDAPPPRPGTPPPSPEPEPVPEPAPEPEPEPDLGADSFWSLFSARDIGKIIHAGSTVLDEGELRLSASAGDIWNSSDAFHYVSREITGDFTAVLRVDSLYRTSAWAKIGIMARETLQAGSAHETMLVSAGCGVSHQRRAVTNGGSSDRTISNVAAPVWLKLERTGSTFSSAYSSDGVSWSSVASHSVTYGQSIHLGVAVTAHKSTAFTTAVVSEFLLNGHSVLVADAPANHAPEPEPLFKLEDFISLDIGPVIHPGSAVIDGDELRLTASGRDIWGASDEFHYLHKEVTGDFTAVVRVLSVENTDQWAKAGLMMRETRNGASRHEMIVATPSQRVSHQRRATHGGGSSDQTIATVPVPVWLMLQREGDIVRSAHSANAVDWHLRATHTVHYDDTVLVGLVLTSHNANRLGTAVVSDFNIVSTTTHLQAMATSPGSVAHLAGAVDFFAASALVAAWEFEDPQTLEYVHDATGNRNAALLLGQPVFHQEDKAKGNALLLDNLSALEIPAGLELTAAPAMGRTLSFWMAKDSTVPGGVVYAELTGDHEVALVTSGESLSLVLDGHPVTTALLHSEQWAHVVLAAYPQENALFFALFLDGTLVHVAEAGKLNAREGALAGFANVGAYSYGSAGSARFFLSDVFIFDSALEAPDVALLFDLLVD